MQINVLIFNSLSGPLFLMLKKLKTFFTNEENKETTKNILKKERKINGLYRDKYESELIVGGYVRFIIDTKNVPLVIIHCILERYFIAYVYDI